MTKVSIPPLLLVGLIPAAAQAASPDPAGAPPNLMKGDRWAEVFIESDRHGYPVGCTMGKTNITYSQRYRVCRALLFQLKFKPRSEDGKPTERRHKIMYIEAGAERQKLEKSKQEAKQN